MKILQLHTGFNLMGGVESMIIGLANEMVKEHDVTVCSVFKPNQDSIFYTRISENVKKVHLGVLASGFSIKNVFRIYKYLRKADFDIIHFHGLFCYFALSIVLLHRKRKFVYTFHSDAYKEQGTWDKRIIWLKRFCLKRRWMHPVTISPQSKDSFTQYYGLDSRLIQNGIASPKINSDSHFIDSLRITPQTKVFFHPGRISIPKNQKVLCRVFQRLIKDGEDVMLIIAGSNQEVDIFNEIQPMFCDRIIYLGERNDVSQLLSEADGFCLPSIWEGLPVTLLEALSVGCVPICSPVGGIVSVVESGKNGILSQSSSEDDYYNAMREFLRLSDNKIQTMKLACKQSFKHYDIKETSSKYISFFKDLIL